MSEPMDMQVLAENNGLPVERVDYPANVHGQFLGDIPCIAINRDTDPLEQQFTIAHEMGHHEFYRMNLPVPCERVRELQANFFACTLLFTVKRLDVLRSKLCRCPSLIPLALVAVFPGGFARVVLALAKRFPQISQLID